MVQKYWRVRLGAATKGYDRYEKVFNLCKNEKPPCIAVGWGDIDLSQDIDRIAADYKSEYGEQFETANDRDQIERWAKMEKRDHVIVMIRPATICAIGEIIHKHPRYHNDENKNFIVEIEGYNNPGKVKFFNRVNVKWLPNSNKFIKVKSLGLPKRIENILLQRKTIIKIKREDYNLIKNEIYSFEPDEDLSPPKYKRTYDHQGKSDR